MPNEYGVLGETSGERHGKRYSIVENVDIELEFASIFPLRSANDLEALERMIADNKDDFKKKLVCLLLFFVFCVRTKSNSRAIQARAILEAILYINTSTLTRFPGFHY